MEKESSELNVLAVGESMSIDYGVLIAINSTTGSNCTVRVSNGCNPREKLHFRFWPGEINPSQTSQGIMALSVMLIFLCLIFTYCCWGTCCKFFQKRASRNRRSRSQVSFESSGSCSSDPRLMMMWSQNHHHEVCAHHQESIRDQQRNNVIFKPRLVCSDISPPPYDVLFGQEINCSPPSYSSLALNQATTIYPVNMNSGNCCTPIPTPSFVAVIVERECDGQAISEARERSVLGNQASSTSPEN